MSIKIDTATAMNMPQRKISHCLEKNVLKAQLNSAQWQRLGAKIAQNKIAP